ncbi:MULTISPECIES: DUF4822 domain-containing protein [unclassified Leucobacter]|uniref:DUF4822 domain-containing protein n=1 Tax=unclassified Leucobacter TaxID=2621730 RepID=UPI000ACD682C|nr:DUF4822 domain-containing protein [Leucobacter sp. Ag1]
MIARPSSSRGWMLAATTATVAAACLLPAGAALAVGGPAPTTAVSALAPAASTPTDVLASTPWVTSGAVDQDGNAVALDDPRAANFVGNAYFKADGTYTMFNLDDSPKLRGDWTVAADGSSRWINAKNAAGDVLFERTVPIVTLTGAEFTYRVVDATDASQWVDIVHTPTTHVEPGTEAAVIAAATAALSATPWETTSSVDQDGNPVALDDPRAANFVGNAYFTADGTYTMFNLDDSPKLRGDWEMRVIGGQLVRWINAKDADGNVLFEREVPIVNLDGAEFTYRVAGAGGAYVDIVHTPTTHVEPGTVDLAAATAALAATPWETTSAVDQDGNPVALDDSRAANFVGNAYFTADGTFTMFNLDDSPKMHGDWEMRVVDGKLARWIAAKNDAGAVLFERIVPIVALTDAEFTYRVVDANDASKWVDIVHTPTAHPEPGTGNGGANGGSNGGANGGSNGGSNGQGGQNGSNGGANGGGNAGSNGGGNGSGENAQGAKDRLAVTGGQSAVAGIVAAAIAAITGGGLLGGRVLMRRLRG